jgi:hypothetical protein
VRICNVRIDGSDGACACVAFEGQMDRLKYLATMAERGRKCAADVLATGRHLDLAKRMLALALECESAAQRRGIPRE